MLLIRFKHTGIVFIPTRLSSADRGGMHDEWFNWKMPKWAKDLFNDPKYLEKLRDVPQEKDWNKKAFWRRLPWNRDFEHMIPSAVDNIKLIDNPSIWQKIVARFNGIPLKGEPHPPKSLFQDIGKQFVPSNDFPSVPKDYKEYPERDLVNFPNPELSYFTPKVRLVVFPDSWFQPFKDVTGVSGPYLLLLGVAAFCFSKEILVFNEDFHKYFVIFTLYLFFQHAFSYRLLNWYDRNIRRNTDMYYDFKEEELKGAREFRQEAAIITDSIKAVKESFPTILKENLTLQLEATYRTNVQNAYTELKRRLDYLSEVEETKERFERDILIKTISEGVRRQIAANDNKIRERYLDNCIMQLKSLPSV